MKTPLLHFLFLFFPLFIAAEPLAPWTKATLHDHLTEINAEWNYQEGFSSLLGQLPVQFSNDQERIKMHLMLVEKNLRARSTEHLSVIQRANRFRHLANLKKYWQRGQFPINNQHIQRQPYFVDKEGTHCAVGYLLAQDQATEIVDAVQQTKNYSYLDELATAFPILPKWAKDNGFTLAELAWIQPGYPPVSRGWNAIGNGGGCNGEVLAMTTFQDEWLVMAGQFSEMDGQAANNIIGWNGENWFNFGEGLNGIVYDLSIIRSNTLLAVGDFSLYDDSEKQNVAIWDIEEERWIGLQSGDMDGAVYTISHQGYYGPFFLGGEFTQINGETGYQNLAFLEYEWQDEAYTWGNEGGVFSVNGPVYDLQMNGYELLVAGEFSLTSSLATNPDQILEAGNLAYWDSYDGWVTTLETDLPVVKSAFLNQGYLYVGDASLGKIDVLNGGLWQQIEGINPIFEQEHNPVNGFVAFNEEIYAYGNFHYDPFIGDFGQNLAAIHDNYAYGLALFDDEIKAAAAFRGELVVAGDFTSVDNEPVNGLASSDLLISDIDDPTNPLALKMWSHGQQVFFKATGLPDQAHLTFYNLQGQLLQTKQFDKGDHQTSFPLDYRGAVLCRVSSSGYQQTFKLALID